MDSIMIIYYLISAFIAGMLVWNFVREKEDRERMLLYLIVLIPVSEGVLTYGAAAIIGIPLVWFLDSIGMHATVVIAGLSLLWPLGDGLPPTALIGRLTVMISDYRESYWSFLRETWLPWLVITAVGIFMVIFSAKLSFLVDWSM